MKRLFKTAMLWLLVLALPVQGFAAAMQSSCAPTLQDVVAVSGLLQESVPPHHQAAAEHQHQNLHAEHADAASDDQTNTHTNVKCSACAAGCMGVAILFVMPEIPVSPIASTPVVSSLSSLFPGHIPDGLKRPPKFSLV